MRMQCVPGLPPRRPGTRLLSGGKGLVLSHKFTELWISLHPIYKIANSFHVFSDDLNSLRNDYGNNSRDANSHFADIGLAHACD